MHACAHHGASPPPFWPHRYERLTSLVLANNDLGKQTTVALKGLLWSERAPCMLQKLDLRANVGLDGYETALAIKRNESLTSLDIREIPSANKEDIYAFLGSYLLQDECNCRLGLFACDAFQVLEGLTELVLTPNASSHGAVAFEDDQRPAVSSAVLMLLAGVLKFNQSLKKLSLAGCGVGPEHASYFATALSENKVLEFLDLSNNPKLDSKGVAEMAVSIRSHPAIIEVKIDGLPVRVSQVRFALSASECL